MLPLAVLPGVVVAAPLVLLPVAVVLRGGRLGGVRLVVEALRLAGRLLPPLQLVRALLVLTRLVVLAQRLVVVVLPEVVPRLLPVERLRSPSFSAVTARTTR